MSGPLGIERTPRWKTYEPGTEAETRTRLDLLERIDRWWRDLANTAAEIDTTFRRKANFGIAPWMQATLQSIEPNLMWEFGRGLEGGHRLVITPESRFDLRPLVDEILRRAPALDGWSSYGHRLPEAHAEACAMVEARCGTPLAATGFECKAGAYNRIDVTVEFPRSQVRDHRDLAFSQAFVLIESLLGEAMLNTWIGGIEVGPKRWRSSDLRDLPLAVQALRKGVLEGLPSRPLCEVLEDEAAPWSVIKLKPTSAEDYAAQSDMFVGKTVRFEQWKNGRDNTSYYSERYSKVGEMFCYLKIDGSQDLDEEGFGDKAEIEDALDAALRPRGLGCVVGGGTGLRYSYIDLALTDLGPAVGVVREVLRAGRLTRRSWLLFYDSEWAHEWVGVWEDSPPPPRGELG